MSPLDVRGEHQNTAAAGNVTPRKECSGICNCCDDCCALLRAYIEYHLPYSLAKSNFAPQFNLDRCRICNLCKEACPVEAIGHRLRHHSDEQDRPVVVEERCIGCGVCAAACPREAITLRKVRNVAPEPTTIESLARHIAEKVW